MGSLSLEGRFIIPKTMPSEATVSALMGVRNIPKEPKSNSLGGHRHRRKHTHRKRGVAGNGRGSRG